MFSHNRTSKNMNKQHIVILVLSTAVVFLWLELNLTKRNADEHRLETTRQIQPLQDRLQKLEALPNSKSLLTHPYFLADGEDEEIRKRATNGKVILITGDYSYREPLWNWIVHAERKGFTNWVLICFDDGQLKSWMEARMFTCHITVPLRYLSSWKKIEDVEGHDCKGQEGEVQENIKNLGLCIEAVCNHYWNTDCLGVAYNAETRRCTKCVGDPRTDILSMTQDAKSVVRISKSQNEIWHLRWQAAMDILNLGIHVLFCDSDAILLEDPFPILEETGADVVSQKGYLPRKIATIWGGSVCMGFAYWKTGTHIRHDMIRQVETILRKTGDDQSAIANAMIIEQVRFTPQLDAQDTKIRIGSSPRGFQTAILPFVSFPRLCKKLWKEMIVAHCIMGGSSKVKKNKMIKIGVWALGNQWERKLPAADETAKEYFSADWMSFNPRSPVVLQEAMTLLNDSSN